MQRSVFSPTFGNQPDKIVGRLKEHARLEAALQSSPGDPNRIMLITGQRGMGKTALLLEMRDQARKNNFVVAKVTDSPLMLSEIIGLIQAEIASLSTKRDQKKSTDGKRRLSGFGFSIMSSGIDVSFIDQTNQAQSFRIALSRLCDKAESLGKGVLLLVDEVQPDSDVMALLAKTFQELVGESKNIAFIAAGLPSAVSHILNERTLTFLNRAQKMPIGTITVKSVATYYRSTFKKLGYELTLEQIEKLAEATRGFPYLLQLVGYMIVNTLDPGQAADDEAIEGVIEASLDELVETTFEPALAPLTPTDRRMLSVVASVAVDDRALVADIVACINPDSPTKGNSSFQPYRKHLVDHGILANPQRGVLEFTIPYLAEYLRGEG